MNVRFPKAHPPKPKVAPAAPARSAVVDPRLVAALERGVRWVVPSGGLQKPGWRVTDRTFDEIVNERREADRFDGVARGRRR